MGVFAGDVTGVFPLGEILVGVVSSDKLSVDCVGVWGGESVVVAGGVGEGVVGGGDDTGVVGTDVRV